MDFLKAGCKICHLHKDEITHELTIRKLAVNPLSRRNSLQEALKQTAQLARRGSLKFNSLVESNTETELEVCQGKVEEIGEELKDQPTGAAIGRLISRCKYLICRLSRLPDDLEQVQLLKATLTTMLNRLEDGGSSSPKSDSDSSLSDDSVGRKVIYKTEKCFNINSLNLKYKGDTCVRTFLTRLEELRVARKIPEVLIFNGFPEILDGPALSWFRSIRSEFTTYREVVSALKEDFDLPDLDYQLLQEIRARTQAKNETIVFFVSTVLGMFERLNKKVDETEKLDILTRNIRPEYSKELALHEITSIKKLKSLCKRIELAQVKASQFKEPNVSTSGNSNNFGDLSSSSGSYHFNKGNISRHKPFKNYIASVQPTGPKQTCFRCGKNNHPTNRCLNSKEIVCFKCGERGVRTPECSKCSNFSKN